MERAGYIRAATALAAGLWCSVAMADAGERRLTFGGFGTVGALYHDEDGIEYRRSTDQPRGAESGELDLATDSLAGVQINAAWSRSLEAVVQGVTRLSADDDWRPQLTRAFVRYNPSETYTLRAGRIGWEIYPRADSRNIGYSQLTMRPAVEVFGFIPTDAFDGAELALRWPVGEALIDVKAYGGRAEGNVVREDGSVNDVSGSKVWGGHVDYVQGPWVIRVGSGVFELDEAPDLSALVAGLRMTGQPEAASLADYFSSRDRRTQFFVAGVAYEDGPLQARLFIGRTDADGPAAPNVDTGLLTAGYRLGDFTPYAMVSFIDSRDGVRGTGLPDTPQFAALNAGARMAQELTNNNQHSLALGLRWDLLPQLALKLQVDRVHVDGSTLIFDRNDPPRDRTRMTVFGLALDFVF